MMARFKRLRQRLDRWALPVAAVGLAAVALHNWRLWQRDKARLVAHSALPPLPSLETWPELPLVSVLVAAWNEAAHIERHIESFLTLRYPHKELILCAGGMDITYALAQRYAGETVTLLEQRPGEGKQSALSRSLPYAIGDIVFLTDADCVLNDDNFERTLLPIINEKESAVTGRFAPLSHQIEHPFVLSQWYVDNYWRSQSPTLNYIGGLIGGNAAIRRELIVKTGGFTANARIGTDYLLALQIIQSGGNIRYVHESIVQTEFKEQPKTYLFQQSRWLRNIFLYGPEFCAQNQVKSALQQCLTALAILSFLFFIPFIGYVGLAIWLVALLHGGLSRFRYVRFGERSLGQPRRIKVYVVTILHMLLDLLMLNFTLLSWLVPALRKRW